MSPTQVCETIKAIRDMVPFQVRPLFHDGHEGRWSKYLGMPARGYAETFHEGPYPLGELLAIEIDPVEVIQTGKYAQDIHNDHSETIELRLKEAGVSFDQTSNGTIRVDLC